MDNGLCQLDVYSTEDHKHLHTLPVQVSEGFITLCSHPSTSWFAVLDCYAKTLDLYANVEHHSRRVEIPFDIAQRSLYSFTASNEFIIIAHANKTKLSVHNWEGEKICTYDVGGKGLGWKGGVKGVHSCGNGYLQVATGFWNLSLHVYSIKLGEAPSKKK